MRFARPLSSVSFRGCALALLCLMTSKAIAAASTSLPSASVKDSFAYQAVESALNESASGSDFAAHVKLKADEADVLLFQSINANEMAKRPYHCHAEVAATGELNGASCHEAGSVQTFPHQIDAPVLKREILLTSLESTLAIFEARIAKLKTLSELKFWQHGDELTVRLTGGNPSIENLFNCHLHGTSYDCHRSRRPGPNEPK